MAAKTKKTSLHELPVTTLAGVGPRNGERLARLGIHMVQDVLFHLPLRYQDRTRVIPIGSLQPGEQVVIEGEIELSEVKFGRRRSLLVQMSDGTGTIILRFFHFSGAQKANLVRGVRLRCFGEVRRGPANLELIHPEYQPVGDEAEVEETLTPIYPTTEGMHQLAWRGLTDKALIVLASQPEQLQDWLPDEIQQQFNLPGLSEAIHYLHRPPPDAPQQQLLEGSHPAQRRLAFEELLAHQISLRKLRHEQRQIPASPLNAGNDLWQQLIAALPFKLTAAQQRVATEICHDLKQPHPMMRLLQGDVGSGKTIVAALAATQAVQAGYQVAMMAPTELLAEQHLNNLQTWLAPLGIQVIWLTGRHKGKRREQLLKTIEDGSAAVIVGTHALFQSDVTFHALGLAIIDEQHRFGVHQRLALREKGAESGKVPHQLIMTATPIPRTLAMSAYADLDISVIDELPPGRTPVTTVVIPDTRRDAVMKRVQQGCREGRQTYWVCTLIEESEALQCQAAEDTAILLAEALPDLRVGLVHGRLKDANKAQVMAEFKAGDLDLLVATTVIEVGVDVPNASLMIIENPERLGLAQLHQLRGRVGRGATESHCVLMYHALSENARERLSMMRSTNDGFAIAQKDLELRGPGEVLGTRQTGEMQLRIADLIQHQHLLPEVQRAAEIILESYPTHAQPLIQRWLGNKAEYGAV
ncbi:ATP-dependent DNA helicase RecG [hydrothermal vent metagenome]|uniref:ATP-dependent DNA helicase RecG n=1 Tax=hydrothermal vent metagenome TaxID=652676 RepID=A0A3B1BI39_9ZZZZ